MKTWVRVELITVRTWGANAGKEVRRRQVTANLTPKRIRIPGHGFGLKWTRQFDRTTGREIEPRSHAFARSTRTTAHILEEAVS